LHVFADPLDHQYGNKQNVSIDVISIGSLCIANKFKLVNVNRERGLYFFELEWLGAVVAFNVREN